MPKKPPKKPQKTNEELLKEYMESFQIKKILKFTGKTFTSKTHRKYYYFEVEFENGGKKIISIPEWMATIIFQVLHRQE